MDKYGCPNSLNFLENPENNLKFIGGEPDERFVTFNENKRVKNVGIYILEKREINFVIIFLKSITWNTRRFFISNFAY